MKVLFLAAAATFAFAGCSGGANVNPTPQSVSQSQAQDAALQQSSMPSQSPALTTTTSLTGRIVYTASGTLRIYNVATKADVSLGVSGVNPKFSPDGTLITYQNSGIFVMNSDGTNSRLLNVTGGVPSFDPTGTMIVYGNSGIWRINVNGTGQTRLTSAGIQPTYSADGTQIAYNAAVAGNQELFIMNADGTNAHQALTSASIIDTVWRPSGKILFGMGVGSKTYGYELHSYDPVTATLTRLTTTTGGDFEPSWSPDATHISWTSGLGGVWIMNADGSGKQDVIPSSKARQGSWGP